MPTLTFYEDENRELILRHTPGDDAPNDMAALTAAVAAAGYGGLLLDRAALDGAIRRIRNRDYFSIAIGRRTDAEYRVDIARNQMSASLTVIEAQGGTAADVDGATAALGRAGVVFGIEATGLTEALAKPGTAIVAARGETPLESTDGRLEPLINVGQTLKPKEDENGRADFRELGVLHSVDAGTPLLRRHPPRPGRPGHNVLGGEIPAGKCRDVNFPARIKNVEPAPGDPNLLIAAISGQPVIRFDGVRVDPVLVLPEVSLATGNIDFIGTVEIKGDVQGGMKIKAGGDVLIHGTLESSEVDAEGSVEVKGGVLGQRAQGNGEVKPIKARIYAKGDVTAHHVENATILAERSVFVRDLIAQSDITAMEEVVVGDERSRKGHVIGGDVRAMRTVTAVCLGGPGSSRTNILVGLNPPLAAAVEVKKAAAAAKRKEQDDLDKVIKVLQTRPDKAALLAKARLTLAKSSEDLDGILTELADLEAELKLADKAEVIVKSAVHPGVAITIGRKMMLVAEDLGAGAFRLALDSSCGREEEIVAFQC